MDSAWWRRWDPRGIVLTWHPGGQATHLKILVYYEVGEYYVSVIHVRAHSTARQVFAYNNIIYKALPEQVFYI